MTLTLTSQWRFGYVTQDLNITFTSVDICNKCLIFCIYVFVLQQAANIVRALELFVKPDVLSGENAYMCAK